MNKHSYEVHTLNWRGITIEVTYERNWLNCKRYSPCHLTITTIAPARCPLPITETGYRSHFTDPEFIEQAGGPLAFVIAELDAAADSASWRKHEAENQQLSLF
ncbi:hypothetical protein ACWGMK_00745 [Agrobacterium deltaense]